MYVEMISQAKRRPSQDHLWLVVQKRHLEVNWARLRMPASHQGANEGWDGMGDSPLRWRTSPISLHLFSGVSACDGMDKRHCKLDRNRFWFLDFLDTSARSRGFGDVSCAASALHLYRAIGIE